MAYEMQVLVANRFGVVKTEIEPAIESVSWRLNNVGMAKMSLPMSDSKCTRTNLKPGNRIVIQWDNGLPDWGGVIDLPRGRAPGVVSFTAFTGEVLLDWRVTDRSRYYTADAPGTIAQSRLEYENTERMTSISVGSIDAGGTARTIEDHYNDLLRRMQDLVRLSGEDFYVALTYSGGTISFALNWYTTRGSDKTDSVALIEDTNASFVLDEMGPLANHIILVGDGNTWGEDRLTATDSDSDSENEYDYREYSEVQSVTNQTTLDANAAALLADMKDLKRMFTVSALNLAPAAFSEYDVGDTVQLQAFLDSPEWYVKAAVRVIAREWFPDDVCRLEVQEVL